MQKAEIKHRHRQTSFTFHGLRDQSVHNIKSLEGADILWVEEAQNVSKKSWRTVIPTIRKPGSEIWISFNPELESDDTYQRFVVSPPPTAVVVKTSFRDNPDLSEELRLEIEHFKAIDPDEYECVYEGMCRQAVTGAVYKNELLAADKEGRICRVPYDASKPVDTSGTWDISITLRSGWLSLSGLSSASLTSFRGHSRAYSITYASFSPAPTFTALTVYPGTVVRRLYRQGGVFATS